MGFEKPFDAAGTFTEGGLRKGKNLNTKNKASEYTDAVKTETEDSFLKNKEDQYKKYEHTKGKNKGEVSSGGFVADDQIPNNDHEMMEEMVDENLEKEAIARAYNQKAPEIQRDKVTNPNFTEKAEVEYKRKTISPTGNINYKDPKVTTTDIEKKSDEQKYEKAA